LAFNGKRNGSSENGISRRIGHGSLLFSPNPLIATGWELSWDFRLKRFLSAISRINRVPPGKRLVGIRETNSHSPSYVNSQDPQTNRRLNSLSPPNSHSHVPTPLNQTGKRERGGNRDKNLQKRHLTFTDFGQSGANHQVTRAYHNARLITDS
jgi:hypothetical protein